MKLRQFITTFSLIVALTGLSPMVAAEIHCPGDDCGPWEPPDDLPDDPPEDPPDQPDPAKYREKLIPLEFVWTRLDTALGGTAVQLSHLEGDTKSFPYVDEVCTTHTDPDVIQCRIDCTNDPSTTPAQRAECRDYCGASTTTCEDVCTSFGSRSWLRWGNVARAASGTKVCNTTTCPACNPAMNVARLVDRALPVPVFDRDYTVGPFSYSIYCRLNRWVFQVGDNLDVQASPAGLTVWLPGTTADPAIHCEGAPDVEVEDLTLRVKFLFPSSGLSIGAEGTLLGDWNVFGAPVDFLADMNGLIADAVRSASHDALNATSARSVYQTLFTGLVAEFVQEETGEQLDILGNIQSVNGGLAVRYWVQ